MADKMVQPVSNKIRNPSNHTYRWTSDHSIMGQRKPRFKLTQVYTQKVQCMTTTIVSRDSALVFIFSYELSMLITSCLISNIAVYFTPPGYFLNSAS